MRFLEDIKDGPIVSIETSQCVSRCHPRLDDFLGTVTPESRVILMPPLVHEVRGLTGLEHMQTVGFPFDVLNGFQNDPTHDLPRDASDALFYNMAGNAFSGGCVLALSMSVLIHVGPLLWRL